LPAPVRRSFWRRRRALARARRRTLERRGDFSRSRPGLYQMDVALDQLLGITGGFFVEAGAFDGYEQSNTYFLERARGWQGILVEAVPFLADEARRERPASTVVNCGLVAFDFPHTEIDLRYGGTMTIVAEAGGAERWAAEAHGNMPLDEPEHVVRVPARTLSSVLDECGAPPVDLLSLDVEGYEAEVLAGLDFERHAPRYILAEVEMKSGREHVDRILRDRYAAVDKLSPHDVLYERRQ
jgi:FkbM family methyltransferase